MPPFSWTLAVSTLLMPEPRVVRFLERNFDSFAAFDEVLLICQTGPGGSIDSIPQSLLPARAKLIPTETRGISASRNVAIDSFTADTVWFMDDDTELVNLAAVRNALANSTAEINTLRFQDTESDRLFKNYGPERDLGPLDLLRVSSIEITCRRSLFGRTALHFPEWIGIGTNLPGGEENLFLRLALRAGARIRHLPQVGCRHPVLDGELRSVWNRPNRMRSMGIVARDCGAIGVLLCLRWSLRGMRAGVSQARIRELWSGYRQGPGYWAGKKAA